MRWTGALLAVARKELVDGIRDRRSLGTLVFSALMTPLLLGVMLTTTAGSARGADVDRHTGISQAAQVLAQRRLVNLELVVERREAVDDCRVFLFHE